MNFNKIFFILSLIFLSACSNADQIPLATGKNEMRNVCTRPSGALPNGSYQNSCHTCSVGGQGGSTCYLTCTCDGKISSADLSQCPENNYCNSRGKLKCGEC